MLADNWLRSKEHMKSIYGLDKKFIVDLKSNRIVTLSGKNKRGEFQEVSALNMRDRELE